MKFSLPATIEIIEKTPTVLHHLLYGISDAWTMQHEGENTWSVFDVIGHLIHGEKTDWIPRAEVILSNLENKTFEPFDRFAQLSISKGKTLSQLLEEFEILRAMNVAKLRSMNLSPQDLEKEGIHPSLGVVTLSQLLATWAVHDLNHIAQISRIMAKQYKEETGAWVAFLRILNQ